MTMLIAALGVASAIIAQAGTSVTSPVSVEVPITVSFESGADGRASITAHLGDESESHPVQTVPEALTILADARMTTLWPKVLAWTGRGMEGLRDRNLSEARGYMARGGTKIARTGSASASRRPLRATFLLADTLASAGRRDEAHETLRRARAALPLKGGSNRLEYGLVSGALAAARADAGDMDGAIATLDESIAALGSSNETINLEVNRAAWLARMGHAQEALAAIDAVQVKFDGPGHRGLLTGDDRIRGSERQFAWIRACALRKLGRVEEAEVAARLLATSTEPVDKRFITESTSEIRREYARCTGDVDAAAKAYLDALNEEVIGGLALLELQPGFLHSRYDPAFMTAVRNHPELAPVLARRMRILPADLLPALNSWDSVPHPLSVMPLCSAGECLRLCASSQAALAPALPIAHVATWALSAIPAWEGPARRPPHSHWDGEMGMSGIGSKEGVQFSPRSSLARCRLAYALNNQ